MIDQSKIQEFLYHCTYRTMASSTLADRIIEMTGLLNREGNAGPGSGNRAS